MDGASSRTEVRGSNIHVDRAPSWTGDKYPGGLSPDHFASPGRFARRFAPGVAAPGNLPPGERGYPRAVLASGEEVEQKFLCNDCGELLREPVQNNCGHRFCRACLCESGVDGGPRECEACSGEGDTSEMTPEQCLQDKAIMRDMAALPACCPNTDCSWQGRFSDYIVHESACEFRSEPCDCGELLEAGSLSRHLARECPLRKVSCTFCSQTFPAASIPEHQERCPLYPEQCPECYQKVPRVNMELHADPVKGDCPKRKCPFGCEAKGDKEHQHTCSVDHINMILQRMVRLEEEVKTLKKASNEGSQSNISITATVGSAAEEMKFGGIDGTLEWRIRNFSQRRRDAIEGKAKSIYSPPFTKGRNGYRMCACVYPNGDGMVQGRYFSVFFVIVRGTHDAELPWPFPHQVTMIIKNQTESGSDLVYKFRPDPTSSSFKRPISDRNTPSGNCFFCTLKDLDRQDSRYVKDDAILLKVIVG